MLDLKQIYGKRYKIAVDASWDAETSENRTYFRQNGEEPYYYEIVGRYGQLYNHSATHLQIWITPKLGARLYKNLPLGWRVHQNASDGCAFVLPNNDIAIAFKWIKPRKRRQGSTDPARIAKLREMGARYRFQKAQKPGLQSGKRPEIQPPTPKGVDQPQTPLLGFDSRPQKLLGGIHGPL